VKSVLLHAFLGVKTSSVLDLANAPNKYRAEKIDSIMTEFETFLKKARDTFFETAKRDAAIFIAERMKSGRDFPLQKIASSLSHSGGIMSKELDYIRDEIDSLSK